MPVYNKTAEQRAERRGTAKNRVAYGRYEDERAKIQADNAAMAVKAAQRAARNSQLWQDGTVCRHKREGYTGPRPTSWVNARRSP